MANSLKYLLDALNGWNGYRNITVIELKEIIEDAIKLENDANGVNMNEKPEEKPVENVN